ncbi:MAG: LysR family transcriptional regulator [Alphaproteobacteria bacterium]|nr:LysR family transcriptional regulator [Alphaproteobacteria bacterium]
MDWDKLRFFHTVARAGSFTGAGEILNLSQSAISRQIGQLERSLGVALFHRHARGLILTEQGELLQKATDEIARKLLLLEGQMADTRRLPEGPLIITVSHFIGTTWLSSRLQKFQDLYPNIQLTILLDDKVLDLGMREADAAIRLHKPKQGDLVHLRLTTIEFHICASKEYIARHGKPENIKELKQHRLIGFPRNTASPISNPNWLLDLANVRPEQDYNVTMINSLYATYRATQTGAGISVLPDYIIRDDASLQILLPEYQRPSTDIYYVYAEERRNSERINAFRDFLLSSIHLAPF